MHNNEMTHTAGPWEISTRPTFGWDVKVKNENKWICGVCFEDDDDKKADALLIAAAPDLLVALMLAKDMMVANDCSLPKTFEVIDAAIAKARGQECTTHI